MSGAWLSAGRIAIKRLLKTVLALPGAVLPRRAGVRVLFYHRVNDHAFAALGPVSREISVGAAAFEAQLAWLKAQGFRGLTLEDCAAMVAGRRPVDPKGVLITFDDGYADNREIALPLLVRYGFPATIFVVPTFLGQETGAVWPHADPAGLGRFLTRDDLPALRAQAITIGSHTLTHPLLTTIPPQQRRREIAESRTALEAMLGAPVLSFAYPGGDLDDAVVAETRAAGYALAFTAVPGVNPPGSDPMLLRRTEVSASDSPFVFRMKMAGALDWLAFKEGAGVRGTLRLLNRAMMPFARAGS